MKQRFTFLLAGLLASGNVFSQSPITLTSANVPAGPTTANMGLVSLTGVAMPARGANITWNFTQLDLLGSDTLRYFSSNNPLFPGSTIYAPGQRADLVTGYGYDFDLYLQGNTTHLARTGRSIPKQDYSASPVTGNPQDSIHIPAQADVYSSPVPVQMYPMTMGSAWQSTFQTSVNTALTIQAFGFNKAPMEKREHVALTDSVVGWGNLELGTTAGHTAPAIPVLLVKRDYQTIDSIFLNGSPAPNAMLAPFGLSQGQFGGDNRYIFYRAGSLIPVMQLWFGANNFTTPFQVAIDQSVLNPLGRNQELNTAAIQVFPNPVAGNSITLQLEKPEAKTWAMQITDLQGRTVQSQILGAATGQNRYQVSVTPGVANGMYTYQLVDEAGVIRNSGKLAVQR